jgi:hypothetical protein
MKRLLALFVLSCPLLAASAAEAITLTPLGRTAALGEGGAEIAAYHAGSERVFVTNAAAETLDVYDFSDPAAPTLLESLPLPGGPNSVDVSRKGLVAVAVEAADKTDPGSVEFFTVGGTHLGSIAAGALPDMLTFAYDDEYLLVANEGEAADDGSVDPEGSVTVIKLHKTLARSRARTASLGGVPRIGEVRTVCEDATFAEDAEPEYIAPGRFGTALVTLQENNAVGLLDVHHGRFLFVRGLGYKDHGLAENALDPSDRDGGIAISPWQNLYGMYQPDAIASYTHHGIPYYVTANEGDAREREGCEEEERAGDLELDETAFPNGEDDSAKLGRLNVTTTQGDDDGDGDYDRLFAFGARSLSIVGPLGGLRWDSGSQLEDLTAVLDPLTFNADSTPVAAVDNRSDNKGPEPEGVDVGEVGGRTYAFLGSERQGGLFAYRLNGPSAQFAAYANTRPADLGPEGVRFVPRHDSPTGRALLLVTHEISGTVSAIEVRP